MPLAHAPADASEQTSLVDLVVVGLLVGVGTWIRLSGLAAWHLSFDELWHLMDAARSSLLGVLARNLTEQVHGPLFHVIQYGLLHVADEPLAFRGPSLVGGVAAIPLSYALGRLASGPVAGLALAAGAALGHRLVLNSQLVRPYALQYCLLTAALVALLAWRQRPSRARLAAYVASGVAAAWLHASSLIPLGALALVAAPREGGRRRLAWLGLHAALLLPPALWSFAQLAFIGGGPSAPSGGVQRFVSQFPFLSNQMPASPAEAVDRLFDCFRIFLVGPAPKPVGWLLAGAGAVGIAAMGRARRWDLAFLCIFVVVASMGMGLGHAYPFGPSRHGTYLIPFLLLPLAAFAEWATQRLDHRIPALAVAGLAAAVLAQSPEARRRPGADFDTRRADLEQVLDFLGRHAGGRDLVLLSRTGQEYLNFAERVSGEQLEHVAHASNHADYPYNVWVMPGAEEHVYRGLRFRVCDGVHLWIHLVTKPGVLERCLEPVVERGEPIERLWLLIEKRELGLALAAPDLRRTVIGTSRAQRGRLDAVRASPVGPPLFTSAPIRFRHETTAVVGLSWGEVASRLSSGSSAGACSTPPAPVAGAAALRGGAPRCAGPDGTTGADGPR